jgi:hypothetical protein
MGRQHCVLTQSMRRATDWRKHYPLAANHQWRCELLSTIKRKFYEAQMRRRFGSIHDLVCGFLSTLLLMFHVLQQGTGYPRVAECRLQLVITPSPLHACVHVRSQHGTAAV